MAIKMHTLPTLSEVINKLSAEGYTEDFNIWFAEAWEGKIKNAKPLSPEMFQIDKIYRFEGASNPDDQAILYAISSPELDIKGILVNGYGISTDTATHKMIQQLSTPADRHIEMIVY